MGCKFTVQVHPPKGKTFKSPLLYVRNKKRPSEGEISPESVEIKTIKSKGTKAAGPADEGDGNSKKKEKVIVKKQSWK